eukprot:g17367.t1
MAWTSIAFSSNGEMIGSDAVVGLPDDMSVFEYEMPGKAPDAVVPFADQEITDASVAQDSANGTTTVTFTRPLAPAGAKQTISSVPGDETILLFAYGPENPRATTETASPGAVCRWTCSVATPSPAATSLRGQPLPLLSLFRLSLQLEHRRPPEELEGMWK